MFFDALIITSLFSIFAISHSILASQKLKEKLTEKFGDRIAFYRMFYNLLSIFILLFIYKISPKPDYIIYDLSFPFDVIIVLLQICSVIALFWVFKSINSNEFLGFSQIKRFRNKTYNCNELDEKMELRFDGFFKYSRHPIYLFTSLFLILRPTMDFFYLIFLINILLYFYIGSYYEEKRLLLIFGDAYKNYQANVPRIFPNIKLFIKK
ncbi:MAG: hypothetical protein L3J41_11910 [Melioribacteraceae bacterium]|nr:hypothetical protein [Melioribacteraceae bacterium]